MKKIGTNTQVILYKLIEAFVETAVGFLILYFVMPLCVERWQLFEQHEFLNMLFLVLGLVIYAVDIEIPYVKSFKTKKSLGEGVVNVILLIAVGRALWTVFESDFALTGAKLMVMTVASLSLFGEFFRLHFNWNFEKPTKKSE